MFENKAQMLKIDDNISSHFLEMHTNFNHTLKQLLCKYRPRAEFTICQIICLSHSLCKGPSHEPRLQFVKF